MHKQFPNMLDLRGAFCPMAFVKTKVHLDRLSNGDIATILYEDTLSNEPLVRSIQSLGHTVITKSTTEPDFPASQAGTITRSHPNDYVQLTLLKIEVNR
jgi:TusA-related sulfurtransferase